MGTGSTPQCTYFKPGVRCHFSQPRAGMSGTNAGWQRFGRRGQEAPQALTQGISKYDALIAALSIFVLAIFVGFEVITKVPPTLHTPLMSGSNAISGITIVGALLVAGKGRSTRRRLARWP